MLRAPICCILGHVDAGKTSLLDLFRSSRVAENEAGGITQQIGASFFPIQLLQKLIAPVSEKHNIKTDIPGILVLDTPGHANFANLRSRGSNICDLVILLVDYFGGLQLQTLESIRLLRSRKIPFVVAINKIDKVYGWVAHSELSIAETYKKQTSTVRSIIDTRINEITVEFARENFNSVLYYKNTDFAKWVSLVPISAKTGDGIADLLALVMQLTQKLMVGRLTVQPEFRGIIMEIKKTGGTLLDVILVDGQVHVGDLLVICGKDGPIKTRVKSLLVPILGEKEDISVPDICAASCFKISASDLNEAVAGTMFHVAENETQIQEFEKQVVAEYNSLQEIFKIEPYGIYIKASTMGSLEALYSFLTEQKIPICGYGIGQITHKDIVKASVMVEKLSQYACILAFDILFNDYELCLFAKQSHVRVMTNDVMYQLVEEYLQFVKTLKQERLEKLRAQIVHPVKLILHSDWIFHACSPVIVGCKVESGELHSGIQLIDKSGKRIGKVGTIKNDAGDLLHVVKKGKECSIRIDTDGGTCGHKNLTAGKHFLTENTDTLYSDLRPSASYALNELNLISTREEKDLYIEIVHVMHMILL